MVWVESDPPVPRRPSAAEPAHGAGSGAPLAARPSALAAPPPTRQGGRPAPPGSAASALAAVRAQMGGSTPAAAAPRRAAGAGGHPQLIALGASTGGVEALRDVLVELPATMPPIVIVQHMPAAFTPVFSGWLDQRYAVTVREARHGETLVAGTAYVAPGSAHLRVRRQGASFVALLDPDSAEVSGHRPSVDELFRSVAREAGGRAWAALLTGMGKDGAAGLLALREAGAHTIAQDEATSLIYGMPRAAVELGAAVQTLGLHQIGPALARASGEEAS